MTECFVQNVTYRQSTIDAVQHAKLTEPEFQVYSNEHQEMLCMKISTSVYGF